VARRRRDLVEVQVHLPAHEVGERLAAALVGTCVKRAPEISWKSSPTRWLELPVPAEDIVSLPGAAFAARHEIARGLRGERDWSPSTNGADGDDDHRREIAQRVVRDSSDRGSAPR
jgi:hypothetical protein